MPVAAMGQAAPGSDTQDAERRAAPLRRFAVQTLRAAERGGIVPTAAPSPPGAR